MYESYMSLCASRQMLGTIPIIDLQEKKQKTTQQFLIKCLTSR